MEESGIRMYAYSQRPCQKIGFQFCFKEKSVISGTQAILILAGGDSWAIVHGLLRLVTFVYLTIVQICTAMKVRFTLRFGEEKRLGKYYPQVFCIKYSIIKMEKKV